MKKDALENEKIYRAGNKVLSAVRLPDEEIDRIVGSPHLFDRVRAGIDSARVSAGQTSAAPRWPFLNVLPGQKAWAAFAALLLFAGVAVLIGISRQAGTGPDLAEIIKQAPPVEIPKIAPAVIDLPEPGSGQAAPHEVSGRAREIARTVKTRSAPRPVREPKEPQMGEFQALTYAGDLNEPGEGGRIVRVELSPASLFAMGVDVPVENETARIKTDLLIGADGVMKGVRVEKKD